MDESDAEAFDRFVERHWENQRKETVAVSSEPVETKPKRRGRRPKSEI